MEEETQSTPPHHSTIDTSSPFTSVKEAVAIFGQRVPSEEIYSSPWSSIFSPSPPKPKHTFYEQKTLLDYLKRLETELEKTKMEVKLLKERESETEVALASLNAELHMNLSKIARSEAARARTSVEEEERRRKRRLVVRLEDESPSLAQILRVGGDQRKMSTRKKKKKSIIPCFGVLFSWKKGCVY